MQPTIPAFEDDQSTARVAAHLIIEPVYLDPTTKALYIHRDLEKQRDDWVEEAHISPIDTTELFGDVASWAEYLKAFSPFAENGEARTAFLTWNAEGFRAVLDYHGHADDPGRCQWFAGCPFTKSVELLAWERLCTRAWPQKEAIEQLEDLADDIREPGPAELTELLRKLRTKLSADATVEVRPDGTSKVSSDSESRIQAGKGAAELPAFLLVTIPVLVGDTKLSPLKVRMRPNIDGPERLSFRFSITNLERVMEAAYADRVEAAREALGDGFTLLRAA